MEANSSAAPTSSFSASQPVDINSGDWRSEFTPEMRMKAVQSLMACFMIKDMALNYERMTYQHARNKDEYIQKITAKLHAVESLNSSHPNLSAGDQTSSHSGLAGAGAGDWQDEIYQKIKPLKESYLPELNKQHQKLSLKLQQQERLPPAQRTEHFEKLKFFVSSLKHMVQILETSKTDVKAEWRDKIPNCEKTIVNLLASCRSKKAAPAESQAQQKLHHHRGQTRSPIPKEPEKFTGTALTTHGHLVQSQAPQKFQHPGEQATSSTKKLCTTLTAENVGYQPAGVAPSLVKDVSIAQPKISASTLLAELTSTDGNQTNTSASLPSKSITTEDPMERLTKLVETMPSNVLMSAVRDIKSVVRMVDMVAGSAPGNTSRSSIGEDLAATTKHRLLHGNFITRDGSVPTLKMKRDLSVICHDDTSETESPAKRQKEEANRYLLEEILETNRKLFYTVISIIYEDDDSGATLSSNDGGTMVKFSFKTNCLSPNLRSKILSELVSPITPLKLLISDDYPECSPTMVGKPQVDASKEFEALFAKAWSEFNASFSSLKQPVSIRETARLWDTTVQKMFAEYAEQSGGGSFTSIYGGWKS